VIRCRSNSLTNSTGASVHREPKKEMTSQLRTAFICCHPIHFQVRPMITHEPTPTRGSLDAGLSKISALRALQPVPRILPRHRRKRLVPRHPPAQFPLTLNVNGTNTKSHRSTKHSARYAS
jgi:hypothetical protein